MAMKLDVWKGRTKKQSQEEVRDKEGIGHRLGQGKHFLIPKEDKVLKKRFCLLVLSVLILGGVLSGGFSSAAVAQEKEIYMMIANWSGDAFWIDAREGLEEVGKLLGVDTRFTGPLDSDLTKQIEDMDWASAKSNDNIESYEKYLSKYSGGKYVETANGRIEELFWQETNKKNTISSYEQYLGIYPRGKYVSQAEKRIEDMVWSSTKKTDKIDAYQKYLKGYPTGRYLEQAKSRIEELSWKNAQGRNTISSYDEYLQDYPKGKCVAEAKEKLHESYWKNAQACNDIQNYELYLTKYPQGKHANDTKSRIEEFIWAEAEDKKTDITSYRKYLDKYPDGKYALQARDCDAWAKTEMSGMANGYKKYLEEYPTGEFIHLAKSLMEQGALDDDLLQDINQYLKRAITENFEKIMLFDLQNSSTLSYNGYKLYQPDGAILTYNNKGEYSGLIMYGGQSLSVSGHHYGTDISHPFSGTVKFNCDVEVVTLPVKSEISYFKTGGEVKVKLEIVSISSNSVLSFNEKYFRKTDTGWINYIKPVFNISLIEEK